MEKTSFEQIEEKFPLDDQMQKLKEIRSNVILPFQRSVPERMIQLVEADRVVELLELLEERLQKLTKICESVVQPVALTRWQLFKAFLQGMRGKV